MEAELERIKQARDRDKETSRNAKHKAETAHLKARVRPAGPPTLSRWLRQSPSGRLLLVKARRKVLNQSLG